MKRRIIPLIALLAILAVVGLVYFNTVFVPIKFKQILTNRLQEILGREVSIGDIKCHPLKGCSTSDLIIYKKESPNDYLLTIEKVDFSIPIPAIVKGQQFIIPSINFEKPTIQISRQTADQWDISDLIKKLKFREKGAQPPPVTLGSMTLSNGKITYTDQTLEQNNTETIEKLNIKVNLSLKGAATFTMDTSLSGKNSKILLEGEYHGLSRKLTAQIKTQNINATKLLPFIYRSDSFQLDQGTLQGAFFDATYRNRNLKITGSLKFDSMAVSFGTDQKRKATAPVINTDIVIENGARLQLKEFEAKNLQFDFGKDQTLTTRLKSSETEFVPTKDGLDINTNFRLDDTKFKITPENELNGTIITNDTSVKIAGKKVDLNGIFSIRDTNLTLSKELSFYGNPDISLHYTYDPELEIPHDYNGTVKLLNATLANPPGTKNKELNEIITNLAGAIEYSPKFFEWIDLKANFLDRNFIVNGDLDFTPTKPLVKSKIKSDNIDLTVELNLLNEVFQIASLKGDYYDSYLEIRGDVSLLKDQEPNFDLRGNIKLNLDNLGIFFPQLKKSLTKMKPEGIVNLETFYKGNPNDWRNWQLVIDASSPSITLFGYDLGKTTIQMDQRDKYINQLNIISKPYGGQMEIKSSADLSIEDMPFIFSQKIENISLAKLRKDLPFQEQRLSGSLSTVLSLNGAIKKLREVTGQGQIGIHDGHLWKFTLFKGIWQILLIPEYENIVFTDASANLIIGDQKVQTGDLTLTSTSVDLLGQGWIDFDNNINFNITPTFKEGPILKSDSLKKAPTALLSRTENYITIKLSGTLNKPSYSVNTEPGKVLENATDVIIDGIQNIFGEIF